MSRKLTKKARGFVNDFADHGNGTLAAKANYEVKNDQTAASIAYENLRKPQIIEELFKLGFDVNNAKRVVAEIMNDETVEPGARLQAADKVFKVAGEYAPEKHLIVTKKLIKFDV